ncbi:hypothetical protein AB6A40_001528 [Gnathostoma spinigerum]|uniref:Leucine-rich repeat-containing protein 59 n=1 Tax=Gnathostoma spinigerum TaxID=75299 RepID=A0ABD6E4D0_9BILA
MAELTVKELKSLLDENTLDLSMRGLTAIPVKALSHVPRATDIDLSNNLLTSIPMEFCFLKHITSLDLSRNRLYSLPNDFGQLINLVHLDLYENKIEELPLSFGDLSSLRWLDVKGNPLEAELDKVAGACSTEKECMAAAKNVVEFMKNKTEKQDQLLKRQQQLKKSVESAQTIGSETSEPKEKNVKKRKKNKDKELHHGVKDKVKESPIARKESSELTYAKEVQKSPDLRAKFTRFEKILINLCVISTLLTTGVMIAIIHNCHSMPKPWIPHSKPLCEDLEKIITKFELSPTLLSNLQKTVFSLYSVTSSHLISYWIQLKRSDFGYYIVFYMESIYSRLLDFAFLIQKQFYQWYVIIQKWYVNNAENVVNSFWTNALLIYRIIVALLIDFTRFFFDWCSMIAHEVNLFVVYFMNHHDDYIAAIERWWRSLF